MHVNFDVKKNELFDTCGVGFHVESLSLDENWRKYPYLYSPCKSQKNRVFLGNPNSPYFWRARVSARIRFNVKNEFFNYCRVGFHFESLRLDTHGRKYPYPYPPWKSHKNGVFLGNSNFLYFWRAQVRARVNFDVRNELVNHCRVCFHVESLSLDENWRKYPYPFNPPPKPPFWRGVKPS